MKEPRRFSLDEDFMNHNTDDLVYGFMRSISTTEEFADPKQPAIKYREYLKIKDLKKEKKILAGICGVSTQQINNKIKKLIETGLVEEENIVVKSNGKEYIYPSYIFPFDYDGTYKIIEKEMVKYLVDTRTAFAIRIYLYLLNKTGVNPHYVFTVRELTTKALGYAESTQSADEIVGHILQSFYREGLIKFHTEWFTIENPRGDQTRTERMVLDKIVVDVRELKRADIA